MTEEKKILIIDDDNSLRSLMARALTNSKISVKAVSTVSEAWVTIEKEDFDLIITDVVLPDGDGLELVTKLKQKNIQQSFIIISAKNNILTAIKANQLDIFEYIPKPIDLNDLIISVTRSLKKKTSKKDEIFHDEKLPMIGNSIPMQNVYKTIAKITKTNHTVLITGESGTGKELVAKAIHDFSERSDFPFIVLNMASLPKELIESELFGYEKGAFTGANFQSIGFFEKANGGTLFLDEIGDMPFEIQSRLLRVLQFGEFSRVGGREIINTDVRIISATNKNLHDASQNGLFREDLFYRLNVINIDLPPLRDRSDDIISLSRFFLSKFTNGKKQMDPSSEEFLKSYNWPGNVRELENLFKRISVLYSDQVITSEIFTEILEKKKHSEIKYSKNSGFGNDSLKDLVNSVLDDFFKNLDLNDLNIDLHEKIMFEIEKPMLKKTLEHFNGNQIKASKLLGINRNTLRSKINKYKINLKKSKI
tara:strand:+ start:2042 stop:3478 length:1437 start_codon:yes stop_codon:yes gene_type:complete